MNPEQLEKQLARVQEWIRSADQKNSIFLALVVGVSAISAKPLAELVQVNILDYSLWQLLLIALALELLIWSIIKSLFCLKPSLNTKAKSLTYFGSIATLKSSTYKSKVKRLSGAAYEDELIEQIHTSSIIASRKHRQLSEAVLLFISGAALMLVGLVA